MLQTVKTRGIRVITPESVDGWRRRPLGYNWELPESGFTRMSFRGLARGAVSLLIAFPSAMLWLAFGPFVVFPPVGYIDPWFYPGYFTNFSYLLSLRGFVYYVTRLPWIVPGLLAFGIAGPQVASLLLAAGIVSVSVVSLYWMVRWYYGGAPAALAAIAMATNPYFMSSAVWQYPDGAAIAYAMAALALYLRPHGDRRWNSFWAAALLVLSGATNMSGGPMVLSILAVPLWRCRRSLREFLGEAACSVSGAAAATLVLAGISLRLLGHPNFLFPQFATTVYAMHTPGYLANMWGSGPGFLGSAVRLFAPAFLLVFGAVLLIVIREPASAVWPVYLALLTCCTLYALQELVAQGAALRVPYHSSYMQVVVLGFAGVALGELSRRSFRAGTLSCAAVALCLAFGAWQPAVSDGHAWAILASIGAACMVLAIPAQRSKPPFRYFCCALLMAIVFLSPALDARSFWWAWAGRNIVHGSNLSANANAESFRCLMNFERRLKPNLDARRGLLFWWDTDEPDVPFFTSAAALFVSGNCAKPLSEGSLETVRDLLPSDGTIVHLTVHPGRIAQRTQLMAARGIRVGNERCFTIDDPGIAFTVVLQDTMDTSQLH